ncbi:uncharacterized protein LOC124143683 isoform X2 [Haliotis rufescens]|uniref:uncharacterized protein LOC124143683 isoform X2 n=1 Tax=Haliotis rufescens TaxID=6454 RepID=UPI001EB01AD8|nr:uncharacterized protein LOC124143683 isoform X2 [Haliotis rufescens]
MSSKSQEMSKLVANMDAYLAQLGLCRKTIVRDGSCLFRAVSEKLFLTQSYHLRIRQMCADYLWRHRDEFEPEWAGQVEMMVLSRLYGVDFIIFQQPECPPANVTQNNFVTKILLCFVDGVHYDIIYPRSFVQDAAICQSILYEILYHGVFGLTNELQEAVLFIRQQKKSSREIHENGCLYLETCHSGENNFLTRHISRSTPPLPYRIAKALDPVFFRNVELDIIQEEKREAKLRTQQGKDFNGFAPGDKCQVLLASHTDRLYNAHIQHLSENQGPVEVFIEELGEKKTVPYSSLRSIPAALKNSCLLPLEGKSKRKKGSQCLMPVTSVDVASQHYHISPSRSPLTRSVWTPNNNSCRPLDIGQRMPIPQAPVPESSEPLENGGGGHYCTVPVSSASSSTSSQAPLPMTQPPVYLVPVVNVPYASSIGQVNFSWGPSQDPYGKDLPLSDMNTLRYFFNLGNEYSRVIASFQQSQQPILPPPPPPPMIGPVDMSAQPMMSHYDQGQSSMRNKLPVKTQISQKTSDFNLAPSCGKPDVKKGGNSVSDPYREKEAEDEGCLSTDSGCVSECSGSLSPSKLESSTEEGDMEGSHSVCGIEENPLGSTECIEINSEGKGKGKRKYYMYGNHKLVKPIKEIPPRFQVLLAETSAAKARCEGQPIYIQQSEGLISYDKDNCSNLNVNANCFVPGQNIPMDMNCGLPAGLTFLPCTSLQVPPSQHPTMQSVPPTLPSTMVGPHHQPLFSAPPPNTVPPSSVPNVLVSSQPLPSTSACPPPPASLANNYTNGGGSCYYVYPSSPSTGFAPIPGTPSQGQGQVVYMVGPSYPTPPVQTFQPGLPPVNYSVSVPCPAASQ